MSFPNKYFEQIREFAYQNCPWDYPMQPLLDEKPLCNAQVQI